MQCSSSCCLQARFFSCAAFQGPGEWLRSGRKQASSKVSALLCRLSGARSNVRPIPGYDSHSSVFAQSEFAISVRSCSECSDSTSCSKVSWMKVRLVSQSDQRLPSHSVLLTRLLCCRDFVQRACSVAYPGLRTHVVHSLLGLQCRAFNCTLVLCRAPFRNYWAESSLMTGLSTGAYVQHCSVHQVLTLHNADICMCRFDAHTLYVISSLQMTLSRLKTEQSKLGGSAQGDF
jgi:hypothetical protein